MDRITCKVVHEIILKAAQTAIAADPRFKGYQVTYGGGRFASDRATLKFDVFRPMVAATPNGEGISCRHFAVTDDMVKHGLAPAGTPITYNGGRGRGIIVKARTKKYSFVELGTNKPYIISFGGCSLDTIALAEYLKKNAPQSDAQQSQTPR